MKTKEANEIADQLAQAWELHQSRVCDETSAIAFERLYNAVGLMFKALTRDADPHKGNES